VHLHSCLQAVTDQKRAWLEAQELARGEQQLASWPQHLIDHFFVVVRVCVLRSVSQVLVAQVPK